MIELCDCERLWTPANIIENSIAKVCEQVGCGRGVQDRPGTGPALRHGLPPPLPGPGPGVRILGEVKKEYADILREADAIFIEELHKADWYHKASQAFVVFLPVKSVGVVGDGRRYE